MEMTIIVIVLVVLVLSGLLGFGVGACPQARSLFYDLTIN
jgi:hypothetical protein